MVCVACIIGFGLGLGGSILLYRALKRCLGHHSACLWHRRSVADASHSSSVDNLYSTDSHCTSSLNITQHSHDLTYTTADESCVDTRSSTLRRRVSSPETGTGREFYTFPCLLPHILSNNSEPSSHQQMAGDFLYRSSPCKPCIIQDTQMIGDSPCSFHKSNEIGNDCQLVVKSYENVSLDCSSFQHSTPEDREIPPVTKIANDNAVGSESMYEYASKEDSEFDDVGSLADVRNAISWHDSVNADIATSRSCISLDDSVFSQDLPGDVPNVAEILATCTAVTSLEHLEHEVADVLSDCGDMERCFGVLRRCDSVRAVAGRYSLGVADSVLATEKDVRHYSPELNHSSVLADHSSLSSSASHHNSGFMWDDDGFGVDSATVATGFGPGCRRSLSPIPLRRRRQLSDRGSLGMYTDTRTTGKIVDHSSDASGDLSTCSLYDINRHLSDRLHIQRVTSSE